MEGARGDIPEAEAAADVESRAVAHVQVNGTAEFRAGGLADIPESGLAHVQDGEATDARSGVAAHILAVGLGDAEDQPIAGGPALARPRAALARALRAVGPPYGGMLRALRHPSFPFVFFFRNVVMISTEAFFVRLPPRLRRALLARMLRERGACFLAVERWLAEVGRELENADSTSPTQCEGEAEDGGYCSHCGACCETASGYPDFPEGSALPERWKRLFGSGLGRGHRFCPFFRESADSPGSLCSVHPWRAHPCRAFGRDDCEFVMARLLPEHPFSLLGLVWARAGFTALRRSVRSFHGRHPRAK